MSTSIPHSPGLIGQRHGLTGLESVETLLLLLGEHDLAALANRRQDGDDERRDGHGKEHRGDRSGQEHRRVAAGDDECPPQVLLEQGSEDEAGVAAARARSRT